MDCLDWICPICFEPVEEAAIMKLSQCGCTFCKPCLGQYVHTLLNNTMNADFTCPSFHCRWNGILTDNEIKDCLSDSHLYALYLDRILDKEVLTNATLTFCPATGCGAICDINPALDTSFQSFTHKSSIFNRLRCWNAPSSSDGHFSNASFLPKFAHDSRITYNSVRSQKKDHRTSFPTNHERVGDSAVPTSLSDPCYPVRKIQAVRITCPKCGHVFCSRCHLSWCEADHCQCDGPSNQRLGCFPLGTCGLGKTARWSDRFFHKDSRSAEITAPNHFDASSASKKLKSSRRTRLHIPSFRRSKVSKPPNEATLRLEPDKEPLSIQTGVDLAVGFPPYPPDALLKRCPTCFVPIERVDGCAQMRCRSCKHTFCWYCLASLDHDVLLRHFDVGACKGKLGHSRGSILGHRIYVISVFTGFTILFIITAPFVLISLPCILCSKCELAYRQRRLRRRHTAGVRLSTEESTSQNTHPQNPPSESCLASPDSSPMERNHETFDCSTSIHQSVLPQTADVHWSAETPPVSSQDAESKNLNFPV